MPCLGQGFHKRKFEHYCHCHFATASKTQLRQVCVMWLESIDYPLSRRMVESCFRQVFGEQEEEEGYQGNSLQAVKAILPIVVQHTVWKTRIRMMRVNREWYNTVRQRYVWQKVVRTWCYSFSTKFIHLNWLKNQYLLFTRLKELEIDTFTHQFVHLFQSSSNLPPIAKLTVHIVDDKYVSSLQFAQFIQQLSATLNYLSTPAVYLQDTLNLPHLTELRIVEGNSQSRLFFNIDFSTQLILPELARLDLFCPSAYIVWNTLSLVTVCIRCEWHLRQLERLTVPLHTLVIETDLFSCKQSRILGHFKLIKSAIQSRMIWCQTTRLVINLSHSHWHSVGVLEIILHLLDCMLSVKSCYIKVDALTPEEQCGVEVGTFHALSRLHFDITQMQLKIKDICDRKTSSGEFYVSKLKLKGRMTGVVLE